MTQGLHQPGGPRAGPGASQNATVAPWCLVTVAVRKITYNAFLTCVCRLSVHWRAQATHSGLQTGPHDGPMKAKLRW